MGLIGLLLVVSGIASGAAMIGGADISVLIPLSSLLFAGIVLLSRRISRFLATVIDTLAVLHMLLVMLLLLEAFDAVPFGWNAYVPPGAMAIAAAVTSALIYACSFIPVIRTITTIGDRFYLSREPDQLNLGPLGKYNMREGTIGVLLLATIVTINLIQIALSVRLNFFSRDMFNAIQVKDAAAFWYQLLGIFTPFATIWVIVGLIKIAVQFVLKIRWRAHLNRFYVNNWLGHGLHYEMQLTGQGTDNPDQRIADDLNSYVDTTYQLSIQLLSEVGTLVSFIVILWGLSAGFTLPGTDIPVPGLLVWVALLYAVFGTWISHLIGRPLIGLYFQKEKVEADYRFSLARIREYGEQIALLDGQHAEGERLHRRFGSIVDNYLGIALRMVKLSSFQFSFMQANVIFPYVLVAPYYFISKITLGQMQQTASAFSSVQSAFNFFIDAYTTLAAYKAVIDRLTTFENAMKAIVTDHKEHPPVAIVRDKNSDVVIDNVSVSLPDRSELIHDISLRFRDGEAVLLTGPSGSGKSTLFRTIAGIWPFGSGKIHIPEGESIMLLPQRPYIPQGTLRDAVTYPSVSGSYDDTAIIDAMKAAKLESFVSHLDDMRLWSQTLSLGEQQRLAIARALLARPDWLFLDEATAALDEETEAGIYAVLKQRLPQTTLVSIGHRSTLHAFHDRRINVRRDSEGHTHLVEAAVAGA